MSPLFRILTWLFAAASLGLLGGCSDPDVGPILVEGQVLEHQSRQPVRGATVEIYQIRGGGYAPTGHTVAADASGRFSFPFETAPKTGYLVIATAPPGYITDWGLAPNLGPNRKHTGLVVPVYPPAWVRLQLVDVPPKSRAVVHIQGYRGLPDTLYYPGDTVLVRSVLVNGSRKGLTWTINENAVTKLFNYDFQPSPLDTLTVRIPF